MIKITFQIALFWIRIWRDNLEIAQSISNSLAKKTLAGKFNGKLIDTTRAITEDGSESWHLITNALPILRRSATPCLPKQLVAFSQAFTWELDQLPALRYWQYCWSNLEKASLVSKEKCKSSKKTFPSITRNH